MPLTDADSVIDPAVIALSPEEQWSSPGEMPTVEEVVNGMGLRYLGPVDAPTPILVPAALLAKIQHWDREQAVCGGRKQELMELAVDLLGIDRATVYPVIDLDTGVVTVTPRETPAP